MDTTRPLRLRLANALTYAIRWTLEHSPMRAQQWVDNGANGYWQPPNRAYRIVDRFICGRLGCDWKPTFKHRRDEWPVSLMCWNCVASWSSDDPLMFEPGTRQHRRAWEVVGDTLFEADWTRDERALQESA